MKSLISTKLIAPCGMNCALCIGFQREKKPCAGCLGDDANKPYHCTVCSIKNCKELSVDGSRYCFQCDVFPCARLKQLDKRYRTKYGMSMIENLEMIQKLGIKKFIKNEQKRWKCESCEGIVCVHRERCTSCNAKRNILY